MLLGRLFERLRNAHLTVNLVKSEVGHAKLTLLGHEAGNTVAPVQANVEVMQSMPAPTNRKDVQWLSGITGYYRRFCPNFADIAKP